MPVKDARRPRDRFMLIGPERVFYAGLLGNPQKRLLGGLGIYAAVDGELEVAIEGAAKRRTGIAIVPPYTCHSISSEHPLVACLLIEPETVDREALRALGAVADAPAGRGVAERIRAAYHDLLRAPWRDGFGTEDFDRLFFDRVLPRRRLDRRVADTTARLQQCLDDAWGASQYAAAADLSVSRFLHLFKDGTDIRFRALRAWKRARNLLHFVNWDVNLAHLALDIGYPDSTHFSHSIRRFYGLRPREIFSGSQRLEIIRGGPFVH
jgi:AraC-like DNA-binding protein